MYKVQPFQYQGARELYEKRRFLLADDMGMFKTSQSIFADSLMRQKEGDIRTLVVCPNAVKEHWQREIQLWASHYKPRVQIVEARNFEQDARRARDSDWTIISYPLISALAEENGRVNQLMGAEYQHIILDEAHNAKNPSALRTKPIKTAADRAEYVSLLSGTPIPNTIVDMYMMMSYLDPAQYPINFDNSQEMGRILSRFYSMYRRDPHMVKRLFHERMLRREAQDYIAEKIPSAEEHDVWVELTGDHAAVYEEVISKQAPFGRKIMQLEKASLDPALVDPAFVDDPRIRSVLHGIESLKYRALDEVVAKEVESGGKVVVFTNLKRGVIDKLQNRYSHYGVVVIDGDIDSEAKTGRDSDREVLRKRFQHDKDIRVMVASTIMNEGTDLTAATGVVNLGVPWTPAERRQRTKRSQRPGEIQKDRMNVYNLITRTEEGSSLEEAKMEANNNKERVVRFMMSGVELTRDDFQQMREGQRTKIVRETIKSTDQRLLEHFLRFRGRGKERVTRYLERYPEASKMVAELYPRFQLARNAADIYTEIIHDLESEEPLPTKVDIACGIGMLGISLHEPTIGFDIDPNMLEVGKKLYAENNLALGFMDNIPVASGKADLAVCSLAYQMTSPATGERERALREANRILRQNGRFILTLPHPYLDDEDDQRFADTLQKLGFEVDENRSGLKKSGRSTIKLYTVKKISDPQEEEVGKDNFVFEGDITKRKL